MPLPRQPVPHPLGRPRRPVGQPTRGKTFPNRLRRIDSFVMRYAHSLLRRESGDFAGAICVDLGYGADPTTTLEMARRLRHINPHLGVVGVEIDPQRVAAAQPFADVQTSFRLGGFNLPVEPLADGRFEHVRLVRAFNVLRQYDESAVGNAWASMSEPLIPGGLLIEGTSDPLGRVAVFNLLRRRPEPTPPDQRLDHCALVFCMGRRSPFDPTLLQAVMPKNFIHRCGPNGVMAPFLDSWKAAARSTVAQRQFGQRQWFVAAAEELARRLDALPDQGWRVNTQRRWLRSGYLIVTLPSSIAPLADHAS